MAEVGVGDGDAVEEGGRPSRSSNTEPRGEFDLLRQMGCIKR